MKNTTITNRTPHDITILRAGAPASDPPLTVLPAAQRGEVARVETTSERHGYVVTDGVEVEVLMTRWGAIVGLPAPKAGALHVVSAIVASAAIASGRGAWDLLCPGDQVRDDRGRIVGCRGLVRADQSMPHLALGAEVWVCYTREDMRAAGVADDILTAACGPVREIVRAWDLLDEGERATWDRLAAMYRQHFGDPAVRVDKVERKDLADLCEALLVRPHRAPLRAVMS